MPEKFICLCGFSLFCRFLTAISKCSRQVRCCTKLLWARIFAQGEPRLICLEHFEPAVRNLQKREKRHITSRQVNKVPCTRLNKPRSVYSLNRSLGSDFEPSNCKNVDKTFIAISVAFLSFTRRVDFAFIYRITSNNSRPPIIPASLNFHKTVSITSNDSRPLIFPLRELL